MSDEDAHLSEAAWTRLWDHTLAGADRRRVTAAVRRGEVLEDPTEALVAAELARRWQNTRRPPVVVIWLYVAAAVLLLIVYLSQRPAERPSFTPFLALLLLTNAAAAAFMRRSEAARRPEFADVERRNLAHARQAGAPPP